MPNINSHLLPSSLFYQVPAARYRYTLHTTRQHVLHTPRRKEKSTSFTKILAYYTYTTLLTKKKKKKKKERKRPQLNLHRDASSATRAGPACHRPDGSFLITRALFARWREKKSKAKKKEKGTSKS
jgi:hypothetical protein